MAIALPCEAEDRPTNGVGLGMDWREIVNDFDIDPWAENLRTYAECLGSIEGESELAEIVEELLAK